MAYRLARVVLAAGFAVLVAAVSPLPSGVAAAQGIILPEYRVTGFRDARFGMSLEQVRQIVRKSFHVDDARTTLARDAGSGESKLIVHVHMHELERELGLGRVEYIFGTGQRGLFQVNVVWGLDSNPPLDNSGLLDAAVRLANHFLDFTWANGSVRVPVLLDDRSVMVFTAADRGGSTVSVLIEDVAYQVLGGGVVQLIPEVSSPTLLTITYTDQARAENMRAIGLREF
jgi:hypothetical protein